MAGNSCNEGKKYQKEVTPLVSVVIPAYNCSRTIKKAIDSALVQNVSLEIIVLDNGGEEDLTQIMAGYSDHPVIRYVRNKQNLGAAKSRNKGVELSRGKYIAFLDADDWWETGKLEKQITKIEETKTVLCTTARELVTPEGEKTGRVLPVKEEITYHQLLGGNSISCSGVLLLADIAKEFPMCHEDSHEDYITWLRILQKYDRACGVNEPLLNYRLSSSGKSGNKLQSAAMTFKVYRYMGFGWTKSILCFLRYAFHGAMKYMKSHGNKRKSMQ